VIVILAAHPRETTKFREGTYTMAFDFNPAEGGDKGHHKKTHSDATHKLHDEVHNIFNSIHHKLQQAKPHVDHVTHTVARTVEHEAKDMGGSVKRELNGTATPHDKHKLETVGKVAGAVLLPHVVIGGVVVKEAAKYIKDANHKTNVHVDVHTPVNHGGSKF
jgi:hypothetical protein